MYDYRLQI